MKATQAVRTHRTCQVKHHCTLGLPTGPEEDYNIFTGTSERNATFSKISVEQRELKNDGNNL
jgi:hypothetical protein